MDRQYRTLYSNPDLPSKFTKPPEAGSIDAMGSATTSHERPGIQLLTHCCGRLNRPAQYIPLALDSLTEKEKN